MAGLGVGAASCSDNGSSGQPADGGIPDGGTINISVDGGVPSSGVRLAVPAYYVPEAGWDRIIAAAPTVGMIIFNPDSGPGAATDPRYTAAIASAQARGIEVLGYVATDYGHRAEADVTADINRYYDLYAPSGIYRAEGPMEADCTPMEDQYHRLSDVVRARDPQAYLAVGTRFCPTYIFFFDIMVQFARNWPEYQQEYRRPDWMPANSPERFVHFIHSVPGADASRALSTAIGDGAGWVFVTDGTDPNPWAALPSYFDQVAALRR